MATRKAIAERKPGKPAPRVAEARYRTAKASRYKSRYGGEIRDVPAKLLGAEWGGRLSDDGNGTLIT